MSARGAMTMRAAVERGAVDGTDDWNRPNPPDFAPQSTVDCWAWSKVRREVRSDDKVAVIEDLRALVPLNADVLEGDRLTITDRLGVELFGGPVAVDTIIRRGQAGSAGSHRELMLTRHV